MGKRLTWALITGEYPPQPGGVSGYTWIVANALAAAGDDVHVYAPGPVLEEWPSPVHVHRLSGMFDAKARRELYASLARLPQPRRAVVQFVLQAFGMRAWNLPFIWSLRRLRGYPLWLYFHEFALDDETRESFPRRVHALGTRFLARMAARFGDVAFVSTPAWIPLIAAAAPRLTATWLPVPSNIATSADPADVAAVRARYQSGTGQLVGHFGTYRMRDSRRFLEQLVPLVCRAASDRRVLLLGRGSDAFAESLVREEPSLAGRILGSGDLESQQLAAHLGACDLLVQPYSDGATTRRGSLCAAIALGVPTVTTDGRLTENVWRESGAVFLVAPDDVDAMLATLEAALADPEARCAVGIRARELYQRRFDVWHTIDVFRSF